MSAADSLDKKEKDQPSMTEWPCHIEYAVKDFPALATKEKKQEKDEKVEKTEKTAPVPLDQMTVGRPFLLRCQGEPVFLKKKSLQIFPDSANPWLLRLLEVQRLDEKSADLVMTSYQAGAHKIPQLILTDGEQAVALKGVAFEVQSVVVAEKGKPPQPFGPMGPFRLSWPWEIWVILGAVIALILVAIASAFFKKISYRKRLSRLRELDTALPAFEQFAKEMRQIKREVELHDRESVVEEKKNIEELNKAFEMYLTRELKVPAHEWTQDKTLKEIKKRQALVYREKKEDLKVVFKELEKALSSDRRMIWQDVSYMHFMTQKLGTEIWQIKKKQKEKQKKTLARWGWKRG